ncbi:hypothetical protein BEP68_09220 [Microbacterium sp. 4-7]|nr:hypothetical protein [Microbacterium sp. 4-7]
MTAWCGNPCELAAKPLATSRSLSRPMISSSSTRACWPTAFGSGRTRANEAYGTVAIFEDP